MIDIHTHILPGLDDGARNLEESIELAIQAQAEGVTDIVATPHADRLDALSPADLAALLDTVQSTIRAAGANVTLHLGCEANLAYDPLSGFLSGRYPTIANGRYVLLEIPPRQPLRLFERTLFEFQLKGYVPILAHAERYRDVQSDVNVLIGLCERGMLIQVTGMSLLGGFGPAAMRAAELLVDHGLCHVIASDFHSPDTRPALLSESLVRVVELVGEGGAQSLLLDVPRAIIEDEPLQLPPPRPVEHHGFWRFGR